MNFFNGNSNEENDFDGFNPVDYGLGNENILTYVPMTNFVPGNERDFDSDLDEGGRVLMPQHGMPCSPARKKLTWTWMKKILYLF